MAVSRLARWPMMRIICLFGACIPFHPGQHFGEVCHWPFFQGKKKMTLLAITFHVNHTDCLVYIVYFQSCFIESAHTRLEGFLFLFFDVDQGVGIPVQALVAGKMRERIDSTSRKNRWSLALNWNTNIRSLSWEWGERPNIGFHWWPHKKSIMALKLSK